MISPDGLNLRGAASTASSVLITIPFGSVVILTAAPTEDNWYPVNFGQLSGWSLGDYLTAGVVDPVNAQGATPLTVASAVLLGLRASPLPALTVSAPRAAGSPLVGPPAAYAATASYYGVDDAAAAGRPTACGAPFDPYNAQDVSTNDWPCGTRLRVTGPDGRSIAVTVTDHGQYPARWLDLTYAAFARLADHRAGTIQVTVEVLP